MGIPWVSLLDQVTLAESSMYAGIGGVGRLVGGMVIRLIEAVGEFRSSMYHSNQKVYTRDKSSV